MSNREVAEVFHPAEFLSDELEDRGWSVADLAARLPGEYGVNHLAIEMYLTCGPKEPDLRMGEMAVGISRALGCDPDFFSDLETAWLSRRVAAKTEVQA